MIFDRLRSFFYPTLLLTAALIHCGSTWAGITVDKNVIDVTTGTARRADILVSNTGDTPTRVIMSAARIDNPGLADEHRWSPEDPRELGMIASPRELSLKPGESRKIRLSFLTVATDSDKIFRLKVEPQDPDVTEIGNAAQASKKIRLTISFDLLIILRPPEPELLYDTQRDANSLTITNTGNSNFLLFNGQQCDDEDQKTNCQTLSAKRIYAGATHTFQLPLSGKPASFLLNQGNNTQAVHF